VVRDSRKLSRRKTMLVRTNVTLGIGMALYN
jgi:hypothetical protein